MTVTIRSRWDGAVLYASSCTTVREAVEEALRNGVLRNGVSLAGADLAGAYLRRAGMRGADLAGADLRGAYLAGADLTGADLAGADLTGVSLIGADLRGAYLRGADLRGADLAGADLRGAYLRGADLYGADLRGADLRGADLRGADLYGAYLYGDVGITFDTGPSGRGWLIRLTDEGLYQPDAPWRITIGCWRGRTLDGLRDLIEDRVEWPEAGGDERDRRRPYLRAILALCEAHIAYQAVAE